VSASCFFASIPNPFATPCGARGFGPEMTTAASWWRDLGLGEDRFHRGTELAAVADFQVEAGEGLAVRLLVGAEAARNSCSG